MPIQLRGRAILAGLLVLSACLLAACGSLAAPGAAPLLSGVQAAPATISPNGDPDNRQARTKIVYVLGRPATVSISLIDAAGRTYPFRTAERRPAGAFEAVFAGAVKPDPNGLAQRVLPDGEYTYVVEATTADGDQTEARGAITIAGADPHPLDVANVVALPATITPNGDARDDKTIVSYQVTKESEVEIFATDAAGNRYLIEPATKRLTGHHSREWNGFSGGVLAGNGAYDLHVVARDTAGNIAASVVPVHLAEGGTPDLTILEVEFTPPTVPRGGDVQVKLRLKNTGDTPIHTKGPPPGTAFTTDTNYFNFTDASGRPKYFDEAGKWRAVASWNQAGRQYPARWALTRPTIGPNGEEVYPPLLPGEETVVTGTIQIQIPETDELHFWGSFEKGAIGFGPTAGQQRIGISR